MKNILEKSKKYIIWFIMILLLLYFIPIPHRIKETVEGVMISSGIRETATVSVDVVEYKYLLKQNTAKGTVTVTLMGSGTDMVYEVSAVKKPFDSYDLYCVHGWRYNEEENIIDFFELDHNEAWTKVYSRVLGEDIEFIAASDGSTETEVKEHFGYRD